MATIPDISIIGPGKVGTALGILAERAGLRVVAVGGGRRLSAQTAARAISNSVHAVPANEAASAGGLVLLTVPDDAIEQVCNQLAKDGAFRPGTIVAHCCGALSSSVLAAAQAVGCETASMHPLQTFPSAQAAVEAMRGTYVFIEGTGRACEVLESLATAIGALPMRTTAQGKALYHAAAVMASNYLVALLDAAAAVMVHGMDESSGMDRRRALAAMAPLVRATVENVVAMGTEDALTGPIARGDVDTIRRHLNAMGDCLPELAEIYRALGKLTVNVASRKDSINEEKAAQILRLLNGR